MDSSIHKRKTSSGIVLLAGLAAMLALATGCPQDDTASMAQQMGAARPGTSTSTPAQQPDSSQTSAGQRPAGMQMATGDSEPAQPPADAGDTQPGDEPVEEGEYDGPKVIIEDLEVDAPYPEYADEGRYDLSFTVELEEATPAAVWQLRALNEEGELVGSLEQFLTLSYGWKKPLDFNGLFCTEMPTEVEMWLTDKEPVQAAEESEEGAGGGSNEAGGGGGRGAAGMG